MPAITHRKPVRLSSLFSRLAVLAALLLALVPTSGRLYQGLAETDAVSVQICTLEGLKTLTLPAAGDDNHGGDSGHSAHDCDYCPLLSSLLAPAVFVAALPAPAGPASRPLACAGVTSDAHPCGLGARGPPRAAGIA